MHKINCLNKISPVGTERFDENYEIVSEINDAQGVLVRSASMHDTTFSENLLAIARAGAGVNNIPIEDCSSKGIVVFNTPGANANAVKELVITALFLTSRKIIESTQWIKSLKGKGAEVPKLVEKGKSDFAGPEVLGKKLGVIGLGAIGILVANSAQDLGMEVYGYDPFLSVKSAWGLSNQIMRAKSLEDIFKNCDYITIHVPLVPDTRDLISEKSIAQMKDGARILNFSRGELVNSCDMIKALESGKISSYATDFPTDELIGVDGVIAIPHLGASTPESEDNCAMMAVDQIKDYLENGNIKNSVNLPSLSMPDSHCNRVCIIHKNMPNTIAAFTSACGSCGANIENMTSKSKGDIAYTVLDIDGTLSNECIENLKQSDAIIRIRIISN